MDDSRSQPVVPPSASGSLGTNFSEASAADQKDLRVPGRKQPVLLLLVACAAVAFLLFFSPPRIDLLPGPSACEGLPKPFVRGI